MKEEVQHENANTTKKPALSIGVPKAGVNSMSTIMRGQAQRRDLKKLYYNIMSLCLCK